MGQDLIGETVIVDLPHRILVVDSETEVCPVCVTSDTERTLCGSRSTGRKIMAESIFPLPVSLEQIAALIRQMSPEDRRALIKLAPELREAAMQTKRTIEDARESVAQLRQEVLQALGGQPLSPDTPFLDGMTLGEYQKLPDAEKARLWDKWGEIDLEALDEVEVKPDAVPAR